MIVVCETKCNCPSRMCCSKWGYCGTTAEYCGSGCQQGKCWTSSIRRRPISYNSFLGKGTYYNLQGEHTACGSKHNDNEFIVALNAIQFDPYTLNGNPNHNSLCNRRIQVKGPRGSITVRVVDRCSGCPYGGLDFSPSAFRAIAGDLDIGVIKVFWRWK